MPYPNTLIFVDLASDDTEAAGKFYAEVFGWTNESRPAGSIIGWCQAITLNPDGSRSEIGNLHVGIFDSKMHVRILSQRVSNHVFWTVIMVAGPGVWVLVSDDDSHDRILDTAVKLGAEILWRDHYWAEFNGYNHAFRDPWGNEILLWVKAGENPQIPDDYTRE